MGLVSGFDSHGYMYHMSSHDDVKLTDWFKSNKKASNMIKKMGYKLSEFGHLNDVKSLHNDISEITMFIVDEYDGVS